jgi:hypothetical protein
MHNLRPRQKHPGVSGPATRENINRTGSTPDRTRAFVIDPDQATSAASGHHQLRQHRPRPGRRTADAALSHIHAHAGLVPHPVQVAGTCRITTVRIGAAFEPGGPFSSGARAGRRR